MIESFRDDWVKDLFNGLTSRESRKNLPSQLHPKATLKLQLINVVGTIHDLRIPPGNRLKQLEGRRSDEWSIRINDQWRIVFRYESPNRFLDVGIEDYH